MSKKPVDSFEMYPVGIALYERVNENGTWINADVSKTYKDGDTYKKSRNYSRDDLLKLNALVPQAISRMQELEQAHNRSSSPAKDRDMQSLKAEAQAHLDDRTQRETQTDEQTP